MPGVKTFHSRLFWKIYISFGSLFLCAAIALSWAVFLRVQRTVKSVEQTNLKDKAILYHAQAQKACGGTPSDLADLQGAIQANRETNVALSTDDGRILAANGSHARSLPQLYLQKIQFQLSMIIKALRPETDSIIIIDQKIEGTREIELISAHKIFGNNGKTCIFWATRISENLNAGLRELWNTTGFIAVFGIVTALGLGWTLVRKIMIPISEMVDVADALRLGHYDRRVQYVSSDELGQLGNSLNNLGVEMKRKLSEVQRLENVRRDFVANVSHEIKTPLTSIKGYVETLQSGAVDDPMLRGRFLEKIERNATRLTTLVQDILSLAKIESLEDSFQLMPLDWNPIIHSVVSRSEDAMGQKGLKLKLNLAPNSLLVMGDREAMIQVLDNLLTNAIKYTPEGGKLSITLSQKSPWAQIDVEDTGIGIHEEHLARIFERFYRVDKARSREMGGTGLGLSIVKHLVSGMGGEVTVTSTVGVGSVFSIRLRLAIQQPPYLTLT